MSSLWWINIAIQVWTMFLLSWTVVHPPSKTGPWICERISNKFCSRRLSFFFYYSVCVKSVCLASCITLFGTGIARAPQAKPPFTKYLSLIYMIGLVKWWLPVRLHEKRNIEAILALCQYRTQTKTAPTSNIDGNCGNNMIWWRRTKPIINPYYHIKWINSNKMLIPRLFCIFAIIRVGRFRLF